MNETKPTEAVERLFSGLIGAEYELLKSICPGAPLISQKVGEFIGQWNPGRAVKIVEIGCGTGMTTLSLLHSREDGFIHAVDNEPAMLAQARQNLAEWLEQGRVELTETDALSGLQALPDGAVDAVASGYAIHNFLEGYRRRVLEEIFRVLKPGGVFVNGDRYALDDTIAHLRLTQEVARAWFKHFGEIRRYDLLEQWIVHLFSDESSDHIMLLAPSVAHMKELGFDPVEIPFREGVDTLVVATKPMTA